MSSEPRYVFGPLDRRTLLLGLRGSQVGVLAVALLVVVGVMARVPAPGNLPVAFAVAAVAALVCFLPIADRTMAEGAPVTARWAWQRLTGAHRFRSAAPARGQSSAGRVAADLPPALAGVEILAAGTPAGGRIGVIADRRADTYTALLAVAGEAFALRESSEKARLLAGWDAVLRSFGGEGSPIHRVQWLERTAPDDGDALGRDLRERIAVPLGSATARSYLEVLDDAGPVSTQHEVLLAVQICPRRAGRLLRQPGRSKDEAACAVLVDQLRRLEGQLLRADLHPLAGGLTPRMTARALRLAADPHARTGLAHRALHHPDAAGVDPANAWPVSAEATWATYRTDTGVHATYWIAEWPRTAVGPDFLAPLLLATDAMRTVAVTMEPIGTGKAIRQVEQARTSDLAEAQLRESKGFLTSHRKRREAENTDRRAAQLQEGYADFRFAGYVTVTAATLAELDAACAEVVAAAQRSSLELRRLAGEQDLAFTYTLPLGRGLR